MKSSFQIGDIISYLEMCSEEKVNLQKGMNYSLGGNYSVILMSLRQNAPYADRIEEGGKDAGKDVGKACGAQRRYGTAAH